ncbi:MAG: class I tRNA ligase family protein [Planctomycetes bacterium]|nr:class I tRNA ligase family protein [Planctomycetota bacterium]
MSDLRRLVAGDVLGRLQRMMGGEVTYSLGCACWGQHLPQLPWPDEEDPAAAARREHGRFRDLLLTMGITLSSTEPVEDGDPAYFRWTQWLFLQFFRRRLLHFLSPSEAVFYRTEHALENLLTRPAGITERKEGSDATVASPQLPSIWLLNVSSYGDRLLNDLGKSYWPLEDRNCQRYRLARLRGCDVVFTIGQRLLSEYEQIEVFTTRVETIYGATFLLLHPWHPLSDQVIELGYEEEVSTYRERVKRREEPLLSAVRTGGFAINPATLQKIPVLLSRLAMDPECGGAIMGVPAHERQLFEMAMRLRLPIREVLRGEGSKYDVHGKLKEPFTGEGLLTNSGVFNGIPQKAARDRIISHLSRRGICCRTTRYFFHQVPVSTPSLWGIPVPLIHCEECGVIPVPEEELPVLPPRVTAGILNKLRKVKSQEQAQDLHFFKKFLAADCPVCKSPAQRDPQVIAPWLGEAWMFLRHVVPELGGAVEGMKGSAAAAGEGERAAAEPEIEEPEGQSSVQTENDQKKIAPELLDDLALFGKDPLLETSPETAPDKISVENGLNAGTAAEEDEFKEPENAGPAEWTAVGDAAAETAALPPDALMEEADDSESPSRPEAPALDIPDEVFPPSETSPDSAKARENEAESIHGDAAVRYSAPSEPASGGGEEGEPLPAGGEAGSGESGVAAAAPLPVKAEEEEGVTLPPEADEEEEEEFSFQDQYARTQSAFQPFRAPAVREWLPVECTFARSSLRTVEVLCTRLMTKFLYDLREIPFYEPFNRFVRVREVTFAGPREGASAVPAAGPVAAPVSGETKREAESKALELIEKYGVDALRLYLVSQTRLSNKLPFSEHSLRCIRRFLDRIWNHLHLRLERGKFVSRKVLVAKHQLIHEVTEGIRRLQLHRAVNAFYRFFKFLRQPTVTHEEMNRSSIQTCLILLFPFAPHLASELWAHAGAEGGIEEQKWPEASAELLHPVELELPVLINNRLRHRLVVPNGLEKDKLEAMALADEKVSEKIAGRPIKKVIAVPNQVINILLEPI